MSRSKFSIVHLVAVSLIVAITAAVVVPVAGAQGGSKGNPKSWVLQQLQLMGNAFNVYASDWDGRLPLAMYRRSNDNWAYGQLVPSPADCVTTPPWNTPERIALANTFWRNSIAVYAPFPSTYLPGAPDFVVSGDFFTGSPNQTHTSMNGLLHGFSLSAIAAPSIVPLTWTIQRYNLKGRAFSNPALLCGSSPTCVFDPNGNPGGAASGPNSALYATDFTASVWTFGTQMPVLRADGSVTVKATGTAIQPDSVAWPNVNIDPWQQVTTSGVPVSVWMCGPGHTAATPVEATPTNAYPCYFRPDRTE